MRGVALRGLLSRKLRTALTMIAILLGVSMISGTYVLTDTINAAFDQIFTQANKPLNAVIVGKQVVTSQYSQPPPVPARLLSIVRGTPGVAAAEGEIAGTAQLVAGNGTLIGSQGGAPTLLFSVAAPQFRRLTIVLGHEPVGNEFALDKGTFDREHLRLGQRLGVQGVGPLRTFTLVGVTKFAGVSSLGGAALMSMDLADAQRVTGRQGEFDQIAIKSAPGVSSAALVDRLRARIPASIRKTVQVKTSAQETSDQTSAIGNALNFITIALLAFGGIAVFVGAFIIFNTFSITVAQRAREFALLRTLGATRAQVLRSVILEAVVVGLLASVVGLLAGVGIAKGLSAVFSAFGADLPNTGLIIATRTVIVALVVGTLVTLLSSLMPAIRATRVAPIAALREGAQLPRGRFARFTPFVGAALTLLGALLLLLGVFASFSQTGSRLIVIAAGAVVLFIGVAVFSPRLVPALTAAIGWPMVRFTSITGRLARENAVRNPSRTAITAAALMIGLALVGFVTIFAAELRKTTNDAVNREIAGQFAVYNDSNSLIPEGVAPALAHVPGVRVVTAFKVDRAHVAGDQNAVVDGIQPRTLNALYHFQWKQGSPATVAHMGSHDALIADTYATVHRLHVGSTLRLVTPVGTHDRFTVTGIYKNAQFLNDICIPYRTFGVDWAQHQDFAVLVNGASGVNLASLKARMSGVLKAEYPVAAVHSQQDIKNQQDKNVNQLLVFLYVMLAMSIIVSLFGIVNTLVLSVYERTREIGMLRAIGTTRSQVRWMVRWESVITAVIGAVLGLALGIVLAVLITAGLSSQGIEFTLPIGQLLLWVVVAVVFGIVAAAFPARRAARLDVLQAIAYE